jgi:acetyl esterase/lipase
MAIVQDIFKQNISFYANETVTKDVDLTMDIYSPKDDTENKRAAVIVAHGGSFVAGAKDDKDQKSIAYCNSLATRGFVAVSIDYRLGVTVQGDLPAPTPGATGFGALLPLLASINQGATYNLTIDEVDYARAVYRGVQDINAAVRYLRANAETYGIDPERIYVLGNSAGAILAIENIYTSKDH